MPDRLRLPAGLESMPHAVAQGANAIREIQV
jgi:hypothetical protein